MAHPVVDAIFAHPGLATRAVVEGINLRITFSGAGSTPGLTPSLHSPHGQRAVQQLLAPLDSFPGLMDATLIEERYQVINPSISAGDG